MLERKIKHEGGNERVCVCVCACVGGGCDVCAHTFLNREEEKSHEKMTSKRRPKGGRGRTNVAVRKTGSHSRV